MNRHDRRASRIFSTKNLLKIAAQTPCGGCTACCTAIGVTAINKAQGERCKFDVGGGCGIYDRRPTACANYNCLWKMRLPGMGPDDRPDLTGIVFNPPMPSDPITNAIVAFEAWPGAFNEPVGTELLTRLVQFGHAVVLVGPNGKMKSLRAPVDHPAYRQALELQRSARTTKTEGT